MGSYWPCRLRSIQVGEKKVKVSEILEECLEEDENYQKMNKVEKLATSSLIKKGLGASNVEVPPEQVPDVRLQLRFVIQSTGITTEP